MFKFLFLMMIIKNSQIQSQTYIPSSQKCFLDLEKVQTLYQQAKSYTGTPNVPMIGLLNELLATRVESLEECKNITPLTSELTCCAGTLVPTDSLTTLLQGNDIKLDSLTLCLQTQMAYTFQVYFDGIKEQFTDMIKSFTMLGCGKYNDTHMCNVGESISSLTCAAYPLNPENLTKGYDTCCLLNFDDFNGKADKKCFDAPKKDIDYLKQVVKNYKNWGYKGVVVDCFGNYIRFGFFSFLLLVLVLF